MRKNNIEKELLDRMHKDPGNWRGVFYFNRKDPRLIVPKIYQIRSLGSEHLILPVLTPIFLLYWLL